MEPERIYEQMVAEGLYPASPKLPEVRGTADDVAAAKQETDRLWAELSGELTG